MKIKYYIDENVLNLKVFSENKKEQYFLNIFLLNKCNKTNAIIEEFGQPDDTSIKIVGINFTNEIEIMKEEKS